MRNDDFLGKGLLYIGAVVIFSLIEVKWVGEDVVEDEVVEEIVMGFKCYMEGLDVILRILMVLEINFK